jgi:quercetin dioxygenase-like cupin family protein
MTTEERIISAQPMHIRIAEVVARHGDPPWAERLLSDGRNDAVLICNAPGQQNDAHVHPDFNEWWVVLAGELIWEIGDYPPIRATRGDVIMAPRRQRHAIRTIGTEISLRLGITKPDSNHHSNGSRSNILKPPPEQSGPPNMLRTTLDGMLQQFGQPPWATPILLDDRNSANLICHGPGMTNNAHWHPDFNEWWTILGGDLTWRVGEDRPIIHAAEGDIVFVPEGMRHHISSVGDGISFRLAVTTPDQPHIYTDDDDAAPPPVS